MFLKDEIQYPGRCFHFRLGVGGVGGVKRGWGKVDGEMQGEVGGKIRRGDGIEDAKRRAGEVAELE